MFSGMTALIVTQGHWRTVAVSYHILCAFFSEAWLPKRSPLMIGHIWAANPQLKSQKLLWRQKVASGATSRGTTGTARKVAGSRE
jgi:hypothetical protein